MRDIFHLRDVFYFVVKTHFLVFPFGSYISSSASVALWIKLFTILQHSSWISPDLFLVHCPQGRTMFSLHSSASVDQTSWEHQPPCFSGSAPALCKTSIQITLCMEDAWAKLFILGYLITQTVTETEGEEMALLEEQEIDTVLSQNWLKFKRESERVVIAKRREVHTFSFNLPI